jgi:pyruvate dehydrogenase complex dehydrogenase (E1) component
VDHDPQETREWLDALDAVIRYDGAERESSCSAKCQATPSSSGACGL